MAKTIKHSPSWADRQARLHRAILRNQDKSNTRHEEDDE